MPELRKLWTIFDLSSKKNTLGTLEADANTEDLWKDPKKAKKVLKKIELLRNLIQFWESMNNEVKEISELYVLANNEKDDSLIKDIKRKYEKLHKIFIQKELEILLSNKYDSNDTILMIHAGTGGTEAQDWVEMLMRMYLKYIEKMDWDAKILNKISGSEAGIKSVTIGVSGEYSYGYLRAEAGTHRLVRISPFDADHARHTSFALVEVIPEIESDEEIEINSNEIRIDTFRSSGAGGQHVNVTDSAVRITHLPTNIVVSCQNERSQQQNRESALKILRSKLLEIKINESERERKREKGDYKEAKWSNQIRSYVLHPYQLVKDHRTNHTVKNAHDVLDGNINEFIDIYLKTKLKNKL